MDTRDSKRIRQGMGMATILLSWIGFKDLYFAARERADDSEFKRQIDEIRKKYRSACMDSDYSPALKSIAACKGLSKVYFFTDIPGLTGQLGKKFRSVVPINSEIIPIDVKNTHNYKDMFESTVREWNKIIDRDKNMIPYFNLSSGTTAMNAIWIVLAGARFSKYARFIQVESSEDTPKPFTFDYDLKSFAMSAIRDIELDPAFDPIIGDSAEIVRVKKLANKAALTDFNILIYGESGTGKELFAEAIHKSSKRKGHKFMAINCAALPVSLLESHLFGYKKGAFTGANKDTPGFFAACDGGTLFLDEVETCPLELQAKLLRALQPPRGERPTARYVRPVGGNEDEKYDVRIIAATNEKLTTDQFRSDLLNRLATLTITLPPLRDRKADIQLLAQKFFDSIIKQVPGGNAKTLDSSAINFIADYPWPGNVRQLQNVLIQAIVFGENDVITADDFRQILPDEPQPVMDTMQPEPPDSIPESFDIVRHIEQMNMDIKEQYMRKALSLFKKKSKAAESLGISYQTWDNWTKELQKKGRHIQ